MVCRKGWVGENEVRAGSPCSPGKGEKAEDADSEVNSAPNMSV